MSIQPKYAGLFAVRQPWDGDTNVYSRADFDYINIIVFNGTTHTVDDSGGADYTRIQDAIDNATPGDTILVYSGTYNENVNVNKQLILQGIDSNDGGKPVVDANRKAFGISINESGVVLDGFEIINSSGNEPGAGIVVTSNNNKIINNKASNNSYGIMLLNSLYTTVENNIANNNTMFQGIVNGPPSSTGIIILGSHNTIRNNNASNNFFGISVFSGGPNNSIVSVNNTIEGNTVINNTGITGPNQPPSSGILLGASNNNIIRNNLALNNSFGIIVAGSHNTIRNNNASNNFNGISVFSVPDAGIIAANNTITYNKASGNSDRGILLDNTNNTTVSNNNASYNGGGILLVNGARNNLIINNIASNNSRWGIDLSHISTDDNILINNTANWNSYNGINLNYSNNNTITNNIVTGNGWNGVSLVSSNNNKIYHNNLIGNNNQAIDNTGTNSWHSGYPSGGNYWSDYTGVDLKSGPNQNLPSSDGIGDTPYYIIGGAGAQDRYPFMRANGWLQPYGGFDTGAGTYPSIMGTHNGTLTLNHSINVTRMYTYPNPGTGGHSEYAAFYYPNGTLLASASWTGYSSDWHNITFAPFALEAGVTYNYTIRTGSYPQIIHKPGHTTPDGSTITSTEFIDANGRRYTDWIPAIRLEQVSRS